jgi:DNA-binding NarL/FixJ family response regulator
VQVRPGRARMWPSRKLGQGGLAGISFRVMGLRVVVGEDSLLVREGIVRLLSSAPDVTVVAACREYDELLRTVEREAPDVVVTDIKMPPTSTDEGIRLAMQMRAAHPLLGVVVLSQYSEPGYVLGLFEAGSDRRAYLLKERLSDRGALLSAIRSVAAGGSAVDPKIVEVLVSAHSGRPSGPLAELTLREREVLAEIAQGKSNSAVADALVLSKRAVEKHINSIFLKLELGNAHDVSKRVKAALMFLAEVQTDPRAERSVT